MKAYSKVGRAFVHSKFPVRKAVSLSTLVYFCLKFCANSTETANFERSACGWRLGLGTEFRGAAGSVERKPLPADHGNHSVVLTGDFSAGGKYVELFKEFDPVVDVNRVSFRVRTANVRAVGLRLTDSTGQIHQHSFHVDPGLDWKRIVVTQFADGMYWGGANDGAWHGPAKAMSLLLAKDSVGDAHANRGSIWVDDIEIQGDCFRPLARLGDVDVQIETSKPLMYYWGQKDAPAEMRLRFVGAGTKASRFPEVQMVDRHDQLVAVLSSATDKLEPGIPIERTFQIRPPRYGLFAVVVTAGGQRLRIPYAWLAGEAPYLDGNPFGVQTHFAHGPVGRHQVLGGADGALDLVEKMGAGWYRDEIGWSQVETAPGKFASLLDPANPYFHIGPAAERRLQPLIILGGTHKAYDGGAPPFTKEGLAGFRRYVETVVKNWKPVVKQWEVWNEPNISPGWQGGKPDPARYAAILRTSYEAIKAIDSKATVIGMASSGVDLKFIERVLQEGGSKSMDAISVHPYLSVAPERPDPQIKVLPDMALPDAEQTFLGELRNLRAVLDRNGAAECKIWITEMGYGPWRDRGYDDNKAAAYDVRQHLLALSVPGIERICKYNFQDKAEGANAPWDKVMGLVRFDGSPKAGFVAYNTMIRMLLRNHFVAAHDSGSEVRVLEFAGEGGRVFAAWAVAGEGKAAIEMNAASATATDLMGNEKERPVTGGRLEMEVTEEPVFIRPGKAGPRAR